MPPVFRPAPHRRLQAWFAIAILALAALAPSISMALSQARGDAGLWQEICRSAASPRADQASKQDAALDLLTMGACAICHLHTQDLAPPPAPPAPLLRQDLDVAMPERFYSASVTAHAWRAAPARAPPLTV